MPLSVANTSSMAYQIVITPLAHLDEIEAYDWNEQQRIGLGEELLTELETCN